MGEKYSTTLGKLMGYMETWWQDPGYGGVIVHSCWETTNLHYTGAHTYTNAQMLHGHLRLYQKFGAERWLRRAVECAEVLASLQKPDGMFRNSTAESDPEEGCLIHNASPDVALLRFAYALTRMGGGEEDARRYERIVEKNLEWMVRFWWNGRRFCGTINQDLCACLAMVLWQKASESDKYSSYVRKTLDYVRSMVQTSSPVNGAIQRSEVPGGRVFGSIYQAVKALLLFELGKEMEDEALIDLGCGAARFVQRQQRADGRFDWGYTEENGAMKEKRLPYINSMVFAECGWTYEPYGVGIDWQKYLPWVIDRIPMPLASEGFAGSEEQDWRNGIPSPDNCELFNSLAALVDQEPESQHFDLIAMSSGKDVSAGGEYVYLENRTGVFRIRADGSPGLDYVLGKKAEYPSAFAGHQGACFGAMNEKGRKWTLRSLDSTSGRAIFECGETTREFMALADSLVMKQAPYTGERILFELSARISSSHSLVAEKNGEKIKVEFGRADGKRRTFLKGLGKGVSAESWSPRLREGNISLDFNHGIRSIVIDHSRATPFGALRFSLDLEPCERLEMCVTPGYRRTGANA